MKPFIDENFLLFTKTARKLFHEHASLLPVIDYHCHLSPKELAEDKRFGNLTQAWLYGDHYKWRAMRTNGVDEKYCTGDASDEDKFMKWAETVPHTLRNPLYHWTHLELKRYFGLDALLGPDTAKAIYNEASAKLVTADYSVRNLLRKMKVEVVCTTDDPVDTLEYHQKLKSDGFEIKVLPAWRPDKAMMVENTENFNRYIQQLEQAAIMDIVSFDDLIAALRKRHDYFAENGCRLSDHGLETVYASDYTATEINHIFKKLRERKSLEHEEIIRFKSAMLYEFGVMDHEKNWVQQFHLGALRNNNTRMFRQLGPDTGFDSIIDTEMARPLSRFLDRLDRDNRLAKTILYNLNPRDNELIVTMAGNFQDGSVPGKIQFGSAWWFLDQMDGMEKQLNALSNLGLLSRFIGMLTDSRSFLSYPRHEYFRRILCNLVGNDVEKGLIPDDMELLGPFIEGICYYNARQYFGF